MTLELATMFLGWCAVINTGLLILWFLFFWLGHDLMYRQHRRLFRLPVETFDAIHYAGLATCKAGIVLLNLVPSVVLALMGRG